MPSNANLHQPPSRPGHSPSPRLEKLKFLQINLNHCRAATSQLINFIIESGTQLVLFQDPYLHGEERALIGIPGDFSTFLSSEKSAGILISDKSLYCIETATFENSIFISILASASASGDPLFVGSLYSPPSSNLLNDLTPWLSTFANKTCLIGGDFNGSHRLWGYSRNNDRGNLIVDLANIYDISIANNPGDLPTYFNPGSGLEGRPDLTLLTQTAAHLLDNWSVQPTESCSDHRYITYEFICSPRRKITQRYKSKFFRGAKLARDLKSLVASLRSQLQSCSDMASIDAFLSSFYGSLTRICNENYKKKGIGRRISLAWWSSDLRTQRNKVNALYRRLRSSQDPRLRSIHQRERAIYKKMINKAKTTSWRSFCTASKDKFGSTFEIIRNKSFNYASLVHLSLDGQPLCTELPNVYKQLIETHFDIQTSQAPSVEVLQQSPVKPITIKEIRFAVHSQGLNKAPGSDSIDPRIVKALFRFIPHFLKEIFNKLWSFSYFPVFWKYGRVIFFYKTGKPPRDPKSYRPICLLQTLSKIYERIINLRLMRQLELNNKLHPNQFGFREKRNTSQCLHNILLSISRRRTQNKYVLLIAIDFQGAFDSASWKTILETLMHMGVSGDLLGVLRSYLTNRSVGFELGGLDTKFFVGRGCPQGSCLGPTLWNVVANNLLVAFDNQDCDTYAYADDFTVILSGDSRANLENKAGPLLEKFHNESASLGLKISPQKTMGLIVGPDLSARFPVIKIAGTSIKFCNEVKILGVVFDRLLNFKAHVESLATEVLKYNTRVRRVGTKYWGVSPDHLYLWYRAVIEPKILYAAEIWSPRLTSHGRRRLNTIQRTCLLKIIKSYKSISTAALYTLTGVPPIYLSARARTKKFQLEYVGETQLVQDHSLTPSDFERSASRHETDSTTYPDNISVWISDSGDPMIANPPGGLTLYTDGSSSEDGVGYGFYSEDASLLSINMYKLRPENSVFQAEASAILAALRSAEDKGYSNIVVNSDSRSVIMALLNLFPKSPIALEILGVCGDALHSSKITFNWVKAHTGHTGNELADLAARSAPSLVETVQSLPFSPSHLKSLLKKEILFHWQSEWDNSFDGRYTHSILPRVDLGLPFKNQVIFYFASGLGSFPSFLHKIGRLPTRLCQCGTLGDPAHFLQTSCSYSPKNIPPKDQETFLTYLRRIDRNKTLLKTLKEIYNALNKDYSFIFSPV